VGAASGTAIGLAPGDDAVDVVGAGSPAFADQLGVVAAHSINTSGRRAARNGRPGEQARSSMKVTAVALIPRRPAWTP
jgi:hypothetical protein